MSMSAFCASDTLNEKLAVRVREMTQIMSMVGEKANSATAGTFCLVQIERRKIGIVDVLIINK